jgi:hypothetical protein
MQLRGIVYIELRLRDVQSKNNIRVMYLLCYMITLYIGMYFVNKMYICTLY